MCSSDLAQEALERYAGVDKDHRKLVDSFLGSDAFLWWWMRLRPTKKEALLKIVGSDSDLNKEPWEIYRQAPSLEDLTRNQVRNRYTGSSTKAELITVWASDMLLKNKFLDAEIDENYTKAWNNTSNDKTADYMANKTRVKLHDGKAAMAIHAVNPYSAERMFWTPEDHEKLLRLFRTSVERYVDVKTADRIIAKLREVMTKDLEDLMSTNYNA